MNDTLDTSLEPNFNAAMKLSSNNYNYEQIIAFLDSGNIIEKQFAALELDEIQSEKDAQILVSNLVGQDGKIREVVAHKINELTRKDEYKYFFVSEKIFEKFFQGLLDINGNVCRQIICLIRIEDFKKYLCENLPAEINKLLDNIAKLEETEKQYVISKRNFQLYWALEALYNCAQDMDLEIITPILITTGEFYDYTIREKTAKILAQLGSSEELDILKEKLKNDENYYVRRYLNKK